MYRFSERRLCDARCWRDRTELTGQLPERNMYPRPLCLGDKGLGVITLALELGPHVTEY